MQHIEVPQDQIYASLPQDARRPELGSNGLPLRWGDPFKDFVGDVNGYEPDFTGYGVYYPPIVAAANRYGANADGHTGWTIAEIVGSAASRELGGGLAHLGLQGACPALLDRLGWSPHPLGGRRARAYR